MACDDQRNPARQAASGRLPVLARSSQGSGYPDSPHRRAAGGTGRRARLRGVWGDPSGFESRAAHHSVQYSNLLGGQLEDGLDRGSALDPDLGNQPAQPCLGGRAVGVGEQARQLGSHRLQVLSRRRGDGFLVGGAADVMATAALTADQPGEQVIGGVGTTASGILPALVEQLLSSLEGGLVGKRWMSGRVTFAAEVDAARIGRVADYGEHRAIPPGLAEAGPVAMLVAGDGRSSGPLLRRGHPFRC